MSNIPFGKFNKSAFGEVLMVERTPVEMGSAVYGLDESTTTLAFGTGAAAGAANNEYYATSGTTATGFATVYSKNAIHYRAGQGIVGDFTMRCTAGLVDSVQYAGLINASDGFAFGYQGAAFGIFHRYYGQQEIQELQITAAASGAETANLTIDGTLYAIPVTAGTVKHNANEIADYINASVPLWNAAVVGDTVIFRSVLTAVFGGAFTFTSTGTTAGTLTQVAAGGAVTESFIPQASWNGEDVDWLDPTKGNVYRIQVQYLGYGCIYFSVENPEDGNQILVHTIRWPNSAVQTHVSNPSFRLGWTAGNRGNLTSLTCYGASYALAVEGKNEITTESASVDNTFTASTTETPFLTIKNREVFGTKVNLGDIEPLVMSVANDSSTKSAIFRVYKNATLTGADYSYLDKDNKITLVDTAATAFSGGTPIETIVVGPVGDRTVNLKTLNIHLLPDESLTMTGEMTSGAGDLTGTITSREDK